jgi:hypothetical protein
MTAPTNAANAKKALANLEPSTHGSSRTLNAHRILRYCFDFSGPGLVPSGGATSTTRLSAARLWILERVMTRASPVLLGKQLLSGIILRSQGRSEPLFSDPKATSAWYLSRVALDMPLYSRSQPPH